tara:strand:- start:926 stop:1657 length:732 start_codon:yes stop_codon:yes gene_type:complete
LISKNSFKKIKSLKQKKFREKHQRLVVEGVRSIESIINDGALIEKIVYTQEFHSKNSDFISGFNNELLNEITENEMDQLSNSITPPGILVVVGYPQYSMFDSNKNAIFLDRISDPGNLGTMIRTASWFGINQIILSKGCIDPFNPKVLAAAMGGHFQLEFLGEEKLDRLNDHLWIGASIDGKPFNQLNSLDQKWILVMGSESHGIENLIRSKLNMLYSIPRIGKGESLNVGVAMGIFLSKLVP